MKNVFKNNQKGFVTLEILIAMTIIVLSIVVVLSVSSSSGRVSWSATAGVEKTTVSSQTNQEALYKAKALLEEARASSTVDFNSVVDFATTETDIITYNKQLTIIPESITQCGKDMKSDVWWKIGSITSTIELTTHLSDVSTALALGGNCAAGGSPGTNWHNPQDSIAIPRGGHGPLGSVDVTDIDVQNGILYMTGKASNKNDFFISYVTDPNAIVGQLELNTDGINAATVARRRDTNQIYAYLANDQNTQQLQIIDITYPDTPSRIATSTVSGAGKPRSIYFYDDHIYLGFGINAATSEFYIFDVSDPLHPKKQGSINVDQNVNAITIGRETNGQVLVYLATSNNNPSDPDLMIFNVTNSENPQQNAIGFFRADDSVSATTLYLLGNYIYLGTTHGDPNFYIIDISVPTSPTMCPNCSSHCISCLSLCTPCEPQNEYLAKENIKDIMISNGLAFILTDKSLRVLKVSDPANIQEFTSSPFGINTIDDLTALDIDGNIIYAATLKNGNVALYKIQPS